jgi:hypothetical protein
MVPAPLISTPSRVAIVYCSGQATLSRDPAKCLAGVESLPNQKSLVKLNANMCEGLLTKQIAHSDFRPFECMLPSHSIW